MAHVDLLVYCDVTSLMSLGLTTIIGVIFLGIVSLCPSEFQQGYYFLVAKLYCKLNIAKL